MDNGTLASTNVIITLYIDAKFNYPAQNECTDLYRQINFMNQAFDTQWGTISR